ncbi:hypothetical protein [Methylobacterium sp. NMS14P]|uniref:hypothetical protein n=1 Tax=Methylobacterium sp. NMS14P TaxID=2894310 RepID=UPI0030764D71
MPSGLPRGREARGQGRIVGEGLHLGLGVDLQPLPAGIIRQDQRHAVVGLTQVLSYQAAPLVAAGRQALVLRPFELDPIPVSLVHVGHGRVPLKVRAFLDFAIPRIRAGLEGIGGLS